MQSPYPLAIKHGNGWKQIPVMDDFPIIHTYIYNIYIIYIHIRINIYIIVYIYTHKTFEFGGFSKERRCFQSQLQALGVEPRGTKQFFFAPKPLEWKVHVGGLVIIWKNMGIDTRWCLQDS